MVSVLYTTINNSVFTLIIMNATFALIFLHYLRRNDG